ncbi:hypothetical protein ACFQ0G_38820 [Streptomyces chiangmaiensis]
MGDCTRVPNPRRADHRRRRASLTPLGLLAEAGLDPGSRILAYSEGDGRLVLRREEDAVRDLLERGTL